MAFIKGKSGNPGGRPKDPTRDLCRKHCDEAVNTLVAILRGKKSKGTDKIKAAEILLNRGYGTPVKAIELSGPDGGPIETFQHVDAPPQETREQWLERRTKELLEAH